MWCASLCRPLYGFSILVEIPSMAFWSLLVCLQSKFRFLCIFINVGVARKRKWFGVKRLDCVTPFFGFLLTCIYLYFTYYIMFSDFSKPYNVPFCLQRICFRQFCNLREMCSNFLWRAMLFPIQTKPHLLDFSIDTYSMAE